MGLRGLAGVGSGKSDLLWKQRFYIGSATCQELYAIAKDVGTFRLRHGVHARRGCVRFIFLPSLPTKNVNSMSSRESLRFQLA